jgi:aryl-alcohol dehydrogenase-like predicted oxidoreductase
MVDKRQLGNTQLFITPIGFGTWALGGSGWSYGWGHQDDKESIEAIRRAVDRGVNWIDTAPIYGLGHAEEVVRKALKDIPQSQRPLIFTKCSLIWDERRRISHSLKAESINREVDESLARLGVETIDLYQIHWPAFRPGDPAPDIEEGWETMAALRKAGKVRHLGVSNFDVGQLERARAIEPVESLQPPYSILARDIEANLLPYCQEHGIGVIVYSPLQSGLLSGHMTRERIASLPTNDWRASNNPEFQEPALSRNLALVDFLRTVGQKSGRSPAEVAIAWTLDHAAVTGAIVGGRSSSQVDGFIGAMEYRLTKAEVAEIVGQL